jgi:hypothetical protein
MKTNIFNSEQNSEVAVSAALAVETRTAEFTQTKTIMILSWFFNMMLKKVTGKVIANAYRTGNEFMLTLLIGNSTHIHIHMTELNKEGLES